jgi:adenylosuccinate lyase
MPHKRNPSDAETLAGLAGLLRGNAAVLSSQPMQHERDNGWMTLAFACIPDSFLLLAAGLTASIGILEGLSVHEATMTENLGLEGGLAMSEALMLAIFRKTGKKHSAHRACFDACNIAREAGRSVRDVFLHDEQFQGLLDGPELDTLLDPSQYIGNSSEQVEAVERHALARLRDIDARRCKLGI